MSSNPTPRQDSPPESWPGVAAGLVIFLVTGLMLILGEIPHEVQAPVWVESLHMLVFWGLLLVPAIGFTAGWINGFPRWSYPYAPLAFFTALYFCNASTPGLSFFGYPTFGREIWGLRAFAPLFIGGGIAWLVTHSFKALGQFFRQIGQDWSLGSYALSGTLPLVIMIAYDEMDRAYSLRDMFILSALMLLMVLFYLRSRTQRGRNLSLGISLTLILGYTMVSTTLYWRGLGPDNVYIPGMIIWMVVLIAFYLSPVIISALGRAVFSPKPET